jgi:hypothetical protein
MFGSSLIEWCKLLLYFTSSLTIKGIRSKTTTHLRNHWESPGTGLFFSSSSSNQPGLEQVMMVCELWTIFWEGGASLLRMNAANFSRLGGLVSLPRMKVEWAFTTHINGGRRPSPLIYVGRYRIFPLKGDQWGAGCSYTPHL